MNWEVVLTGDKSDLEELSKVFKDKDLSIVQENEQFITRERRGSRIPRPSGWG